VRQHLAHRVSSSLEPFAAFGSLFRRQYFDKAIRERREAIGRRDVSIERRGVILRQHKHPNHIRVNAVRDRNVDEPILAAERHRGFRSVRSQREETLAGAATENHREKIWSRCHISWGEDIGKGSTLSRLIEFAIRFVMLRFAES